jgi:flagellar hook-associated protein 1 FlgK
MTTSLLNIGSSSLAAAQGALSTISHNIANANTPGYSRQEAVLSTAGGLYTGSGFFGRGVDLTTVRRQYDQFLTTAVQSASAVSAADAARASGLGGLDATFANNELGIGASVDALFAAAGDLANRPSDLSARQAFLARAGQLAERVVGVGQQLVELGRAADGRLVQDAGQVNQRLTEIHQLNGQIAQAHASGQPPNDLLDQRDAALQALNGLLTVHTVAQDDGTLSLFTASGAPLLVGNQQARLDAAPDPADPSRSALRLTVGTVAQWLDPAALGGGSLAGTARLRDQDLTGALNQVGRLAQVIASAVNSQQALGVDMDGKPGVALFTVPGPVTVPHAGNSAAGTLSASVADASALQPSDYQVAWDGSNYTITRLADGQTKSYAALPAVPPTLIDGLAFLSSGTPAAGDSWLVKPLAAAATGLAARPATPRQLATGFAATVEAAAGNQGGATASGFQVVRASADNVLPVSITFNNPPTTFNVSGLTAGNLTNVPYKPGEQIPALTIPPAPPADYNGWVLTLDGVPAAGDSFAIKPVTAPGSDNRNALALGALAGQGLVGGATINEAYAALLGDVGNRVQSGRDSLDVSNRLQADAVGRQQNVAGVNLDEEAANLLRYQQAYQASARVIQASQSLFDALLSATGR